MTEIPKEEFLSVRVSNPDAVLWLGEADSVSSRNLQGDFDILPQHANFITIIQNNPIIIQIRGGEKKEFHFDSAIIYTYKDSVQIFANI
ncbi:hypothetical protein IID26_02610 [Patescibacteria group bacterium]|nr:hypothetical protein [Patescibacteria group bacterium]